MNELIQFTINNSQKSKFHMDFAIYTLNEKNEKILGFVFMTAIIGIFLFNGTTNEFWKE